MTSFFRFALGLLVAGSLAGNAFSQVTTFVGSDNPRGTITNSFAANTAFLSSFALTGTDTMESYPVFAPTSLSFPGTSATAANNCPFVIDDTNIGATFSISPNKLLVGNFAVPDANVFQLSRPVNGFGLFIVNAGDAAANQFTLQLFSSQTGITKNIPMRLDGLTSGAPDTFGPGRASDAVLFLGVRDTTPFDMVTISTLANSTQDGLLFDNASIGFITGVPEPTTYALIGGILALGYGRHRYVGWKMNKKNRR